MLRLPSRSGAGAGFKQTISQPSPSESLPGEQDYPLLPGPGSAPAPVSRPRDVGSQRQIWVGREGRGQRGGAGKGAMGKVSDGTQRPRRCKGLVWASCPQLRTLLLSGMSPEWTWGRGSEGGGQGEGHPVWT